MKLRTIVGAVSLVTLALSPAAAGAETPEREPSTVENRAGQVLENAGEGIRLGKESASKAVPDPEAVSENFGEALSETGKVVGRQIEHGRAAAKNFGEALGSARGELASPGAEHQDAEVESDLGD